VATLEFLLLNHPLDCPICDRGGECPLQDQALAFGPGESRYVDSKRTYEKPLYLSALVALDRERCVLCARCTRFCDQISGDRFIELFDRGAAEQVSIAPGEDFRSPFSGNTIQICPVGALTAVPYRFVARPFDLKSVDTVCPHCSAGCNIRADLRRGRVVRHLARDNPDVNDVWTCDKGRFAFSFPDSDRRLNTPLLRIPGLEPVSFAEAFSAIAEWSGAGRVAFLTGGRLMDEDYYALSKLARAAFHTNDLDHRRYRRGDVPDEVEAALAAGGAVTYRAVEEAGALVVVGLDAEQEVPILHLRIRKAARRGAKVFVIHPRRTRLWDVGHHLLCRPGEEAALLQQLGHSGGGYGGERPEPVESEEMEAARAAVLEAGDRTVVLAGARLAESEGAVAEAARLAEAVGGRFAFVPRRAGDRCALRAGVHPALLPGGRLLGEASERAQVEAVWGAGTVPTEPGRDQSALLEAAARREIDVLFLVGVDPLRDFPDAALARRALQNVGYKVVQDISSGPLAPFADAVLPAAAAHEKDGHFTDWEGRPQRVRTLRASAGMARPDWQIFQELSEALGHDMGFRSLEALQEEMHELMAVSSGRAGSGPTERTIWTERSDSGARESSREVGPDPSATRATGSLVLFTYPLLVDEGILSEGARELKDALEEDAFVEIHPEDAEALGLEEGHRAILKTEAGTATVPVRVTPHIAPGAAFVPFNQPGLAANTLLSGRFVTEATVEPAP
jgi:NADH-quinone oxidoreductase subunit G